MLFYGENSDYYIEYYLVVNIVWVQWLLDK